MTKKLNENAMATELAGSTFFKPQSRPSEDSTAKPPMLDTAINAFAESDKPVETPRAHDTVTPRDQVTDELLEKIRKAVRQLGKEDATYRFTSDEKKGLAEIVYTYGAADMRTSQNEITRIGINFMLEDYRANGGNSILARVLERLNA